MKKLPILLLSALLLAAPASQLSALPSNVILTAEESLTDATAQQVLDAAAPLVGESSASLMSQYRAGIVTITDLGPVRGGHSYRVSRVDFVMDLVINS
jgi:hypothetical protein